MSSPITIVPPPTTPLETKNLLPMVEDSIPEVVLDVLPQPVVPAHTPTVARGRRQTKKKRKRVGRACVFCQRSHMSCDDARPCRRCVARGCADQCRDPDGKRKRRGRKRKTALPEDENGSSSDSDDDLTTEDTTTTSNPMNITNPSHHGTRSKGLHDDLHDHFGQSLDACESQGSRPFFITKPKRSKLKDYSDDDMSDVEDTLAAPLAGPASHFGMHSHHTFDEDEHISALSSATTPMAVPRSKSGSRLHQNGPNGTPHDDFAQFNIYPELLTLPSPVSGSTPHHHLWFPSPRSTQGSQLQLSAMGHSFEMGDAHFVASPVISGLATSFGNAHSCGSTSFLNTPNAQKGFNDFYPSGSTENGNGFEGFIL